MLLALFQRGRMAARPSTLIFPTTLHHFSTFKTFKDLGVDARIVAGLNEMQITTPTAIQQKSIPAILTRHDVLCAAQTGTGKTLGYLVPVIEQLLRNETVKQRKHGMKEPADVVLGRPSVLVLLPSRELALQVASVTKQLSHTAKFASCTITSGERKSIQQKNTARRLDLVIGTPGRVAKCIREKDFYVSRITTVVVDEADTLFDVKMGFRNELDAILDPIQASATRRNQPLQMILAAATIRSPIHQMLTKKFKNLRFVSDDRIHKTPSAIREEFVRVNPENKQSALREALHLHGRHTEKTMIFCRNAASVRSTEHMLREHGFRNTVCLHGDMPPARRHEAIRAFTGNLDVKILVCSDLAARGLDVVSVKHVVMFDFPKSAVDYVHRAGRTGRAGAQGLVTSLVTKHDLALSMSIENSKRSNSNIKGLCEDAVANKSSRPRQQTASLGSKSEKPRRVSLQKHGVFGRGTKKLQKHKIRASRSTR